MNFNDNAFWNIAVSPEFNARWGEHNFIREALGKKFGWTNKYNSIALRIALNDAEKAVISASSSKNKAIAQKSFQRIQKWVEQVEWIEQYAVKQGYQVWGSLN